MNFLQALSEGTILFDGAMGTQIQALDLKEEAWEGKAGLGEILNLTVPDKIRSIHTSYLHSGSQALETNTFGANRIVLEDYGLADLTEEINYQAALLAREAADSFSKGRSFTPFVAGSIGPGTKLPSLGQTDFDTLHSSYLEQASGLLRGGVDLFLIETCQDLLQIKTAVIACRDALKKTGRSLPILVSFTVETSGTLLVGSDLSAVIASLYPLGIDALGLNCALGPEQMRPYIRQICESFPGPVICQPNAGLPENRQGSLVYTLPPESFAATLKAFVEEEGVSIVGGCCGTSPEYISILSRALKGIKPKERYFSREIKAQAASLFSAVALEQEPKPFFVGERNNTNGSKEFRQALLSQDWEGAVNLALEQQETGAHGIDLCVAYAGRKELADMVTGVKTLTPRLKVPLFFDSTDPQVLEEALKNYGGRAIINSINLEEGEEKAKRVLSLAARYGAGVIALTIDEEGMAATAQKKVAVARRLRDLAYKEFHLLSGSLIIDPLTFTLGSGEESLRTSARETLSALRQIKETLPGVFTILGVSNVSYGLNPEAREVLNSVFLKEAVEAGLDLAIINVKKIIPLHRLSEKLIDKARKLIYPSGGRKGETEEKDPLLSFIDSFKDNQLSEEKSEEPGKLPVEEELIRSILKGSSRNLETLLEEALGKYKPAEIISEILIPGMRKVGELFSQGRMQLPFVLQSAEIMKRAVMILEPFMEKTETSQTKKIVLATVRGDVHDIGKNLVDIILSNNGYKVYNLGTKCEIDSIIKKAVEVEADALGMSGLLVKSSIIMKENIEELARRGIEIPVLLGGAALTRDYVAEECAPLLKAPVFYCKDAFEGLRVMNILSNTAEGPAPEGDSAGATATETPPPSGKGLKSPLKPADIPSPPFWGRRLHKEIDLDSVYSLLSEELLFKIRWGYKKGRLSDKEYRELLENRIRPEFQKLKDLCSSGGIFLPQAVYGYFPCKKRGDSLTVYSENREREIAVLSFPRQKRSPGLCLADYFSETWDCLALQAVTLGSGASKETARLYGEDRYKEYLLLHGLSVETTEALAEHITGIIRKELGFPLPHLGKKALGKRYSFGYPPCPDLEGNRVILNLLDAREIGIDITETGQMVPEQTTCAFFIHHPQAEYFIL